MRYSFYSVTTNTGQVHTQQLAVEIKQLTFVYIRMYSIYVMEEIQGLSIPLTLYSPGTTTRDIIREKIKDTSVREVGNVTRNSVEVYLLFGEWSDIQQPSQPSMS